MKSLRVIAYLIDYHYISVAKQLNTVIMSHITLDQRQMEFAKAANCKFTAGQVLELMVLFPFFAVKNGHNFAKSILGQMFACRKDMFYRFLDSITSLWT